MKLRECSFGRVPPGPVGAIGPNLAGSRKEGVGSLGAEGLQQVRSIAVGVTHFSFAKPRVAYAGRVSSNPVPPGLRPAGMR